MRTFLRRIALKTARYYTFIAQVQKHSPVCIYCSQILYHTSTFFISTLSMPSSMYVIMKSFCRAAYNCHFNTHAFQLILRGLLLGIIFMFLAFYRIYFLFKQNYCYSRVSSHTIQRSRYRQANDIHPQDLRFSLQIC